ncbi:MAG: hypothetical protein AAGB34_08640 [Planctomycetota bacterium]
MTVQLDEQREFSGMVLTWASAKHPVAYRIESTRDLQNWETVAVVQGSDGDRDEHFFPEHEALALRIITEATAADEIVLSGIKFLPLDISDHNAFLREISLNDPRGHWPMVFENRQVFWTVAGNEDSDHEALISEHGVVEVNNRGVSIEPFIRTNEKFYSWANSTHRQLLQDDSLPIPTVLRRAETLDLLVTPLATRLGEEEVLLTRYLLRNRSSKSQRVELGLAIRPLQVLPPWQMLNRVGGWERIQKIQTSPDGTVHVDGMGTITVSSQPEHIGATTIAAGGVVNRLASGRAPDSKRVFDPSGMATASMIFERNLEPGGSAAIVVANPLATSGPMPVLPPRFFEDPQEYFAKMLDERTHEWAEILGESAFVAEGRAKEYLADARAQIGYMLINMDGPKIQPGSRTYERSWIRDGALTGSALVHFGHTEEVAQYLEWYAEYQYENGKIPCVVDHRGADPTDEHDSTGQYIYLVRLLADHLEDPSIAIRHLPRVERAVAYLQSLRAERSSAVYLGTAMEGLVPESISHEGYSAQPMHSYWDNVFVHRGLVDAAAIAALAGRSDLEASFQAEAEDHAEAFVGSVRLAIKEQDITYIPGCVELGDFDPPSTAIMVFPGLIADRMPEEELRNTFERYWSHFRARAKDETDWFDYTPYELRVMTTMIKLGMPERAHEMYQWLALDRHPSGWRHWAEIAYRDDRVARFIGDMPHTWVGSGLLNSVRAMFVYEDEPRGVLVLAAGLESSFLEGAGARVSEASTRWGPASYTLKRVGDQLLFEWTGRALPPNGIEFHSPLGWKFDPTKAVCEVEIRGRKVIFESGLSTSKCEFILQKE